MAGLTDLLRIDRTRHFLVALAISVALGAAGFFAPLDWLIWMTQARMENQSASGEIVYVGGVGDMTTPARPKHRKELARLIDGLGEAGASKIFLDVILQQPSTAEVDQALAQAIEKNDRTFLVQRYTGTAQTGPILLSTIDAIARTAPSVVAKEWIDPFGATWTGDLGVVEGGVLHPSLAGALANVPAREDVDFRINYSIDHKSVPSISMPDALSAIERRRAGKLFEGKLVVIGNGGGDDARYRAIPGNLRVPASMVSILGGETLIAGPAMDVGWVPSFGAFAILLGWLAVVVQTARYRWLGYFALSLSVPVWFLLSPRIGTTTHLSVPIALLAVYAALRLWKRRLRTATGEAPANVSNFRPRHLLVAMIGALVLGVTGFLAPLDWLIWGGHARIFEHPASQEIVFIGGTNDLAVPTRPEHRREVAALIEGLGRAGAKEVFLDVRFEEPSEAEADEALARAIKRNGHTSLVERYRTTVTGPRVLSTIPAIAGTAPRVIAKQRLDPFGWAWSAQWGSVDEGKFRQSFAAALADASSRLGDDFRIDYSIDYSTVPSIAMPEALSAIEAGELSSFVEDKFVVIGNGGAADSAYAAIPGHRRVPASMVAILAGETLRAGVGADIGWLATFLLFAAPLAAVVIFARSTKTRRWGYAFVLLSVPAWLVLSAYLRTPVHLSIPIAFLAIFGLARAWNARSRATSLVDEISGLPNFRALEKDLARRVSIAHISVVVARIHRFDEVLSILPTENHEEYVSLVADRFRITGDELAVYSNSGRYLAWIQEFEDEPQLEAHLRGLRAVFAHPLKVAGTAVDVGITFGADATRESVPARKIASATAAADRTTEADTPVVLADAASISDRMWNVSLQAKIDAALKSGEIYVVFQPQFHLPTGRLTGFEALVRWNDPERGLISPSYFIEQCEHAGRMEALTRKVIQDTVIAIRESSVADPSLHFSINVSATLLNDTRVAWMLEDALTGTGIEPARITLELTETARIADYDRARTVLNGLREAGFRVSIDDFGVGAASLETLLRLPFDELKIDRAFVSRIGDDGNARHMVDALIRLCKGLGLEVIAEGVEDHATLDILKSMGCEGAQGYVLGRPDSLSAMKRYLQPASPRSVMAKPG